MSHKITARRALRGPEYRDPGHRHSLPVTTRESAEY